MKLFSCREEFYHCQELPSSVFLRVLCGFAFDLSFKIFSVLLISNFFVFCANFPELLSSASLCAPLRPLRLALVLVFLRVPSCPLWLKGFWLWLCYAVSPWWIWFLLVATSRCGKESFGCDLATLWLNSFGCGSKRKSWRPHGNTHRHDSSYSTSSISASLTLDSSSRCRLVWEKDSVKVWDLVKE